MSVVVDVIVLVHVLVVAMSQEMFAIAMGFGFRAEVANHRPEAAATLKGQVIGSKNTRKSWQILEGPARFRVQDWPLTTDHWPLTTD